MLASLRRLLGLSSATGADRDVNDAARREPWNDIVWAAPVGSGWTNHLPLPLVASVGVPFWRDGVDTDLRLTAHDSSDPVIPEGSTLRLIRHGAVQPLSNWWFYALLEVESGAEVGLRFLVEPVDASDAARPALASIVRET